MKNILGYIELDTGKKPITPMNDVFIAFTFHNEDNWSVAKDTTNIMFAAYSEQSEEEPLELLTGEVDVQTQFPNFRNHSSTTPNRNDVRIEDDKQVVSLEAQNDPYPTIPISKRSLEYLSFALTRGEHKKQTFLWLINGSVKELLDGQTFSYQVRMDRDTHRINQLDGGILYIDLPKLAKQNTQAGELARVLIGTPEEPTDELVRAIQLKLKDSFSKFKNDTEVHGIMSRDEMKKYEGIVQTARNFLKMGLTIQQIIEGTGLGADEVERLKDEMVMS